MSRSALAHLPVVAPPPPPAVRRPRAVRPRPSERRTLWIALGVSAAIHLLVVLLSPTFIDFGAPRLRGGLAPPERPLQGLRVYDVVINENLPADAPLVLPRERVPQFVAPRATAPGLAAPAAPGRLLTPAERLAPRVRDRRLWVLPNQLPPAPKSDEERMRERVYARIEALNDSLAGLAEAHRRANDWTLKGEDGSRWGISSEGIHLGKITIPAPSFGAPAGRREEIDGRLREWGEIQQQSDREAARQTIRERAKAIREQKAKERAEEKKKDQ
ncbi:MAG: hypothetical protein HY561_10545 [Gemmatimonadetes bacterium]|nr:hypothetical protein [Gemmatimonadota bacterium]